MRSNELRTGNFVNYKWFDKTSVLIDGYPRQKTIIHREVLPVLAVDGENNRALIKTKQHRKNQTWVSLGKLTPIPLTEEILLKCGFERIEVNNEDYYNVSYEKQISKDVFVSYADDFSFSLFWTKEDSISSYGVLPNWHSIDTVHGLQNLHFILTGEELNIQL